MTAGGSLVTSIATRLFFVVDVNLRPASINSAIVHRCGVFLIISIVGLRKSGEFFRTEISSQGIFLLLLLQIVPHPRAIHSHLLEPASPPSLRSSHDSESMPPPPPPPQLFPDRSTPPSPDKSDSKNDVNLPATIGVLLGAVLFLVLIIILCICCSKRKRKRHDPMHYYKDSGFYSSGQPQNWGKGHLGVDHVIKMPPSAMISNSDVSLTHSAPHGPPLPPPSPVTALGLNKSTFSYEELAAATNGFSPANLLGQGGFGYVHKGVLPNGEVIAVKQLKSGSVQGEREFLAEVDIISRVQHRHLVSLVGYCVAGSERMLVYEFVPNNTLEHHLHGKELPVMQWSTRLKIALGAAKGIAYLHEECHPHIIHRDIKAANILLDFKFEAMVADFGLAKISSENHTHVSTRVMGTLGYLAPEYASSGKLTEKSDIFSYGVMLLELITGRRPVDNVNMEGILVEWARPVLARALADGNYDQLADPRLDGNYDQIEMARMVAAAAASVHHSAKKRPKMSQIVRALEGDISHEDLNDGLRPGHSVLFSSGSQ